MMLPAYPSASDLTSAMEAVLERLHEVGTRPAALGQPWSLPVLPDSRLHRLQSSFGLSEFELTVVVLGAAVELVPELDKRCAPLIEGSDTPVPTFGLAAAVFPDAHWDAFAADAPLRRLELIDLHPGPLFIRRRFVITERVLHSLLGLEVLDPHLARRCEPRPDVGPLPPSHDGLAERVSRWLSKVATESDSDATAKVARAGVQLWSNDLDTGTDVAIRALARAGLAAHVVDAHAVPPEVTENERLAMLWTREMKLQPVGVVLVLPPGLDPATSRAAEAFASRVEGPLVVVAREPTRSMLGAHRLEVPPLPFDETLALWKEVLGDGPTPPEPALRDISAQFSLGPSAIRRAAESVQAEPEPEPAPMRQRLWHACRLMARPRMADLAQHVDVRASFDDLVLPTPQLDVLHALVAQVRHRATVFHAWGFAQQQARGAGLSAVFAGPSGTGKTMAAEAIANVLQLDLYRIDLSAVVSKYVGETEENLRRVFDAAEAGGAVLLFDEADALFGKRTEVRDSHDRHANIEVSYLLQRMETYVGLAILTTNMRKSLDDAFLRRVQFILEFPFPEADLRARIWRGAFPSQLPRDGLDYDKLARLSVAGGNIRSIVRNAAYIAADEAEPVRMAHILRAARLEFDKMGRSLPPAEIRGWVA